MFKKKGITTISIIFLILSIISLLVLISVIMDFNKASTYQSSLLECSYFLKTIDGKPGFFKNTLDSFAAILSTALAKICPAKEVKITSKNILPAVKLVEDCWIKSGKGVDFMASNINNKGLCIYCGSIKADTKIDNFNENFQKELNKEKYEYLFDENSEIVNLNKIFLNENNLNFNFDDDNNNDKSISVFYYIYKPEYPDPEKLDLSISGFSIFLKETVGTELSKFIGNQGGIISSLNFLFTTSNINSFGGVVLSSNVKLNSDDENYIDSINSKTEICTFIIPEKIYN